MNSSKEQILFEILETIILNAFTVTFDQFNVPLMNKSINFFYSISTMKTKSVQTATFIYVCMYLFTDFGPTLY